MVTLLGNLATNLSISSSSGYCEGKLIASFFTPKENIEWDASLVGNVVVLGLRNQSLAGIWLIISTRSA